MLHPGLCSVRCHHWSQCHQLGGIQDHLLQAPGMDLCRPSTDFIWCYVAVAAASAVCSEQFKTASWAPEKGADVYYNTISDIFKR